MINHISRESKFFQDFKQNHEDSPYKDMFIRIHEFFPENRPTPEDIDLIYKRKDKAPFQEVTFADGTTEQVWNTFGEEQIDLDVTKEVTKQFIKDTLKDMASHDLQFSFESYNVHEFLAATHNHIWLLPHALHLIIPKFLVRRRNHWYPIF